MKNLLIALSMLFVSNSAVANIGGALFINSDNSKARLVITETMEEGALSDLFEQMNIPESGDSLKKSKEFETSNGRFSFLCSKGYFTNSPPTTSCTWTINGGPNTGELSTFISELGSEKIATIGMTSAISQELSGIFPESADGSIKYLLELEKGVVLEANGVTWGNLSIGFSAK